MTARRPLSGVRAQRHAQIVAATRLAELGRVSEAVTPTQALVLDLVKSAMDRDGVPPSVRELAVAAGLGSSTVAYNLVQLQTKGYLRRDPGKARGLVLTDVIPCTHCGGTGRS